MISRRKMIKQFAALGLFSISFPLLAANKKKKKKKQKVEQTNVEFTGVLSGDEKSGFAVSGNEIPLEIDGSVAFRIKKYVGQTVKVEGSKIKKGNAKPYIRVKHITPVNK